MIRSLSNLIKGNEEGYADSNELAQMSELVESGMKEGAIGLSAGLTYTPAMYASDDELIHLCKVVAKHQGYYAPHHRNYGAQFLEAVDACIEISRASGSALHLTHCHMSAPVYHDKTELLFERIEKAEHVGIDITLDTYPYLAGSTYLHALLPSWAQAGGVDQMAQRLKSAEVRSRVIDALNKTGSDGNQGGVVNWKIIVVAGVEASLDLVGLSIEEAANRNQIEPASFYLDLIAKEKLAVRLLGIMEIAEGFVWDEIIPVSAAIHDQVDLLNELIGKNLPTGPEYYPAGTTSDQAVDQLICEYIREAALQDVREELPHSIVVTIDEFGEREEKGSRPFYDVHATIHVERDTQRAILLGHQGARLKEIGIRARADIERVLGAKIFLGLHIKVSKEWQKDPKLLAKLGFGEKS